MHYFDMNPSNLSLCLHLPLCQVAQMERAHSRLQKELEGYKESNQTQEHLRDNRLQVDQLQEQADRLTAELSSLQTAHNTLRLFSLHRSQCKGKVG